ncbi:MAG: ABC transporter ATP-binding protein [Deltaproteobacteria bacterium]|nr:ABC transporter ATP-binding protein [Deltaproteobacteria bacterium]
MLRVSDLSVSHGHLMALRNLDFHVSEGELVTFIGSNGAGKSTLLNTLSGLVSPQAGSIRFEDREIVGMTPEQICGLGIIQVPEGRKLFARMTVLENLEMGAYLSAARRQFSRQLEVVFDKFPRLKDRKNQIAGTMSGGEQQMLAIARAMVALPKLLMLDEPSLGLSPLMAEEIYEVIQDLNGDGMTILLVSQEVHVALSMADRGYVLENGVISREGEGKSLLEDPAIRASYLGI